MGVKMLHRIFFHLFCSSSHEEISSGARSALPMGVAPEAIVKESFEYRLKYSAPHLHISTRNSFNDKYHRGCASALPDGSSPRGYNRRIFRA
jgi:hypothetical protein